MATVRDMLVANNVITRLSTNPNVFVTTAYKLLPILTYLTDTVAKYNKVKEDILAADSDGDQKEKELTAYLDSEVILPSVQVGVNSLRNCGLTMVDLQYINWWLVEFADEYED